MTSLLNFMKLCQLVQKLLVRGLKDRHDSLNFLFGGKNSRVVLKATVISKVIVAVIPSLVIFAAV
jgi:hypothetical protein